MDAAKRTARLIIMKKIFVTGATVLLFAPFCYGQTRWINVDSLFQPLPVSVHVYKTTGLLDGKPNIAFYVEADIKDKKIEFTVDTTYKRRLKPSEFYQKKDKPLVVVNTTFFSFITNQNLNVVIKNGKLVGYNIHTINGRGKDTFTYHHPLGSAIGISKKREPDVAWVFTDSFVRVPYYRPLPLMAIKDSTASFNFRKAKKKYRQVNDNEKGAAIDFKKWKMRTAVGGGPVLLQNGQIKITNNEELKFAG
jgi:hypothetical protein